MKFHSLPIGARFEFEDAIYTKTGPLVAVAETGGQRIIPRYASLRPLDGMSAPVVKAPARTLDEAVVHAAFDVFCRDCLNLLDESGHQRFESARRRFLEAVAS
jgi:hypothetical protein